MPPGYVHPGEWKHKMLKIKPPKRKTIALACSLVALAVLIPICGFTIYLFSLLSERQVQREVNCATIAAEPIAEAVINDLCERGLVPVSLGECGRDTFQIQDIMPIVRSQVFENVSTYSAVTHIFGNYERHCGPKLADRSDFICNYYIGRSPNILIFYNSETEIVTRVTTPSCTGGS